MKSNRESFEEIALPHLDIVYRAAVAICGNRGEAEDLVQDTFIKAFERFELFKKGTNCKAWLLQILRNTWFDRLRHKKVTGLILPLEEEFIVQKTSEHEMAWSNADDLLENFSNEQIIKALIKLSHDQRLTVFLIDVEQLSHKEVAKITDVAVGTVKSRASRARAVLKNELSSYTKNMRLTGGEK